ncbi:flavodoxin domain-containing protein [Pseudooceanicola algae]|uniref:Cindoxin n=1 Tax=Pseudooceanicola algae TaxID=1537215 RepID=A0A418SK05_9RHOB|nr:flavodoxin domain-containing protein [Pseudooceanicola algae]QPM92231.1 Cindoxin [Pseudooceanicola algae]
MKIALLYGTETGTTEMLCEDLEGHLGGDHEVEMADLGDTDPTSLDGDSLHLILCSTYGDGELPATAQPFAQALIDAGADLSGIRFAIFGLGDSTYETFNEGSQKLAELLVKHGAKQVGDRTTYDAMSGDMPEDSAFPWAEERIAEAEPLFAAS